MNLKFLIFAITLCGLTFFHAEGQYFNITGKIVDRDTKTPMTGVYVSIVNAADNSELATVMTDQGGNFKIANLYAQNKYQLKATFLGYAPAVIPIVNPKGTMNMGFIVLSPQSRKIKEVVVNGEVASAVQNGDTTELNARAFATNPDATAEDLMKKMPGITVDNSGTVTAQGETVQKVLVDGKEFFGDDPTIALRNLPAEVIDKVQIFDKLSDQAELTGIDDGNSQKTLNIITKQNRRNGTFGKFFAGDSYNGRYMAGGDLNIFNHTKRISVIGLSNNINQQNFSTQDLLGVLGVNNNRLGYGGGSMRRGGGGSANFGGGALNNFLVGQQSGVSATNSLGLNYTNSWGKKINVTGSLFVNTSKNITDQTLNTKYILTADSSENYEGTSNVTTNNYNYRISLRFEYDMDSLNSLIITPRLNFQNNQANTGLIQINPINSDSTLTMVNTHGYNIANDITFRHKFMKRGRTFSIDLSNSNNENDSKSTLQNWVKYVDLQMPSDTTNQRLPANVKGYTLGSNIVYTEPMNNRSLIQFGYNLSYTKNNTHKDAYNFTPPDELTRDTVLSNVYNNTYITNRAGIGYRIRTPKLNFAFGTDYQRADLNGSESYPTNALVSKTMEGFLPNLMFHYRFSPTHNFFLRYRESTTPPSIQQLQNVINNSNPQLLSTGNPTLKQQNANNMITRYSFANPDKSINYFIFGYLSYTQHYIGNSTLVPKNDTVIGGYTVKSGVQLTQPVNLDHSWNTRALLMYSFPVGWIKTKVNLLGGGSFVQTPGFINQQLNRANAYNINGGFVLASNINENVDYTVSYTANYNMARNSIQSQVNNNYWSHNYEVKLNLILWKGIVFQNDFTGQIYNGLTGVSNTNYNLWDMGLGKKFFKNKSGELKFSVFDLLNQNKNISRTVSSDYIQDSSTNTLRRYYMLTFTYTLRNFKGMAPPQNNRRWGEGHLRDF